MLVYLPNDPSTPELLTEIPLDLPNPCPPFAVAGWTGDPGTIKHTPQYQAAMVYGSILTTLKAVQPNLGRPLSRWQSGQTLTAFPRAGTDFNAYYDRSSLKFFYNTDRVINQIIFTCESSDVVSHETGHAILDALRPDLWGTASLEIMAFHESFGDMIAISSLLTHAVVIDKILKETNGDLGVSNVVSRVGEELGIAIFHMTNGAAGHADCLRNAVNEYQYVNPDTLPFSGPGLIHEPHSFSQVFTGAWYECLVGVYRQACSEGLAQADAVRKARDVCLQLLLKAVVVARSVHNFFNSVAQSFLEQAGFLELGKYKMTIMNVLAKRKVYNGETDLRVASMFDSSTVDLTVEGHHANIELEVPILGHKKIVVEIPQLGFQHMGMTGGMATFHLLDLAARALKWAHHHNLIGLPEENKMFAVNEGRLIRNYICSAFCKECQ